VDPFQHTSTTCRPFRAPWQTVCVNKVVGTLHTRSSLVRQILAETTESLVLSTSLPMAGLQQLRSMMLIHSRGELGWQGSQSGEPTRRKWRNSGDNKASHASFLLSLPSCWCSGNGLECRHTAKASTGSVVQNVVNPPAKMLRYRRAHTNLRTQSMRSLYQSYRRWRNVHPLPSRAC
jgi:hypothetical protein